MMPFVQQGTYPQPMRLAQPLGIPFAVNADITRNHQCSNQYLVLSTSKTPPRYFGTSEYINFLMYFLFLLS